MSIINEVMSIISMGFGHCSEVFFLVGGGGGEGKRLIDFMVWLVKLAL